MAFDFISFQMLCKTKNKQFFICLAFLNLCTPFNFWTTEAFGSIVFKVSCCWAYQQTLKRNEIRISTLLKHGLLHVKKNYSNMYEQKYKKMYARSGIRIHVLCMITKVQTLDKTDMYGIWVQQPLNLFTLAVQN